MVSAIEPLRSETAIRVSRLDVPLREPFKIASMPPETACKSVLFRAAWEGIDAVGESAPFGRYGDSVDSVLEYVERVQPDITNGPFALRSLTAGMPRAVRCGVDVLLHDLLGKAVGRPIFQLLGLDGACWPVTARTISIGTLDEMLEMAKTLRANPILKIKVGLGKEYEFLEALRSFYSGEVWLDANEGWSPEEAVHVLKSVDRFGIALCEQPIRSGQQSALRSIREQTKIPIVADEDSVVPSDLYALAGSVDGINVKLAKCGGILAALEMIAAARALGLKVMLGSMLETPILSTAAAHIAPLVDWLDLDCPLMLRDSPYIGVCYHGAQVQVPVTPGLGVVRALGQTSLI
jgi:L-alanine-DL-glutamate epimerase-like enolase superfamily enzyme